MKRSSRSQDVETLIAYIQPEEGEPTTRLRVLNCFKERGLATADQVATLSGVHYKTVMVTLTELALSSYERPAALKVSKVSLEGQNGRPKNLYILTSEGASALRVLLGVRDIHAPGMQGFAETVAPYAMMEIYARAIQDGCQAQVEKVLPFGAENSSVRADVLVTVQGRLPAMFEFEQEAAPSDQPRILDKLLRMQRFFLSEEGKKTSNQVVILFNLLEGDSQTLKIWSESLAAAEDQAGQKLAFQLYWQPILKFLEKPCWNSLEPFSRLQAAILSKPEPIPPPPAGSLELTSSATSSLMNLQDARTYLQAYYRLCYQQMDMMRKAQSQRAMCRAFFELILVIYQASYFRNSATLSYAALPVESLEMYRRYLYAAQNRMLLAELKSSLKWLQGRTTGVTQYRNGVTQIHWDVFLRYHGLARGGPLIVNYVSPNIDDPRSDYYTDVRILSKDMYLNPPRFTTDRYHKEPEEVALGWALDAYILYSVELGLGDKIWSPKAKKRS